MSEFVPIIFHVGWQVFQILVSTESSMSSGEGQFPSAVRCSSWQMNEEPFSFLKSVFFFFFFNTDSCVCISSVNKVSRNSFHRKITFITFFMKKYTIIF